jgi:hypothetical protein
MLDFCNVNIILMFNMCQVICLHHWFITRLLVGNYVYTDYQEQGKLQETNFQIKAEVVT